MRSILLLTIFAFIYTLILIGLMSEIKPKVIPVLEKSKSPSIEKIAKTKKNICSNTSTRNEVINNDTILVTITYYQPLAEQCSGNPLLTADGSRIDLAKLERGEIKWCAVSPDLYKKGGRIWIDGMGVYEIHDKTSARHRAWVDILISPNHKPKGTKKCHKVIIF